MIVTPLAFIERFALFVVGPALAGLVMEWILARMSTKRDENDGAEYSRLREFLKTENWDDREAGGQPADPLSSGSSRSECEFPAPWN